MHPAFDYARPAARSASGKGSKAPRLRMVHGPGKRGAVEFRNILLRGTAPDRAVKAPAGIYLPSFSATTSATFLPQVRQLP